MQPSDHPCAWGDPARNQATPGPAPGPVSQLKGPEEVATAIFTSNPLLKAIEKEGPLSATYICNQCYKESFNNVEHTEYILDAKEKMCFQYVPVLRSLQHHFVRKNVLDRLAENHRAQKSNRGTGEHHTYRSSQDGSYFVFWH